MFDFAKLAFKNIDPTIIRQLGVEFSLPINLATGEAIGRRQKNNPENITYTSTAKFEGYTLKLPESHCHHNGVRDKVVHHLILEGSFHKNAFGHNYSRFTYDDFQKERLHLCSSLSLMPIDLTIQNLEIGVNMELDLPKDKSIDCVMLHSTSPLTDYLPDETGKVLGRVAKHSQFSIKCYSKSLQYDLEYPVVRFEIRCIKMQRLAKYSIKTLADLCDINKVVKLSEILIAACESLLICDPDIDPSKLAISPRQKELLREGCNRDFWVRLHANNRKLFNKKRAEFRKLTSEYSYTGFHAHLRKLIISELTKIFPKGTALPYAEPTPSTHNRDSLTVLIKGKSVSISPEDISNNNPINEPLPLSNNHHHPNLYITYESSNLEPIPHSDMHNAFLPPMPECISLSCPADTWAITECKAPQDTPGSNEHSPGHQTTDEYDGAKANCMRHPEASMPANTNCRTGVSWITARFLNKL